MKHFVFFSCAAVFVAWACLSSAQDKSQDKKPADKPKAGAKPPSKKPAKAAEGKAAVAAPVESKPAAASKRSPDEVAVEQTVEGLVKAYNDRDAKAFAAAFTANGEYIDETRAVFHGQAAIEAEFAVFLAANPATSIQVQLDSIRAVGPGIMAADGSTQFVRAKDQPAVSGHCSLICTKDGKKWQIASLRETQAASEQPSHHDQLKQLEWLVGEW